METIQKFFTVGFLLVSIIPLVRLMISVNNSVVGIFATQIDLSLGGQPAVGDGNSDTFNTICIFLHIFICKLYLYNEKYNACYINRFNPIFVVSMAFSSKGKGLFDNWLKEISANIFYKHSMYFRLLSYLMFLESRGIEQIVVNL